MANIDRPRGFQPEVALYGGTGAFPIWEGAIKSNNVMVTGDVLYASAGYVRTVVTGDKGVVGICAANRNSAGGDCHVSAAVATRPNVLFWPNLPGVLFGAQCSGTFTQAKVWCGWDFEGTPGNSTGWSNEEVNEDVTTTKHCYIVGVRGNSSIGANTEVLVSFVRNKFAPHTVMSAAGILTGV